MNLKQVMLGLGFTLAAVSGAQALTIGTVDVTLESAGVLHTTKGGVFTEVNFDDGACAGVGAHYASCTGDYALNSATSGIAATPYNDAGGKYMSVPDINLPGSVTLTPGGSYDYFGFYWGSIDKYNTITFYSGGVSGTEVASFGGGTLGLLSLLSDGQQQIPDANRFINFEFTANKYDTIVMSSTSFAFESDNHTFGNVPEPSSLALLAAGMIGLGVARRAKRK